LSFCLALLVSGIFSEVLASAVRGGRSLGAIPAYGWVYFLGYPVLLAVSVVAVFRLVRRDLLSAFVAPVVYLALTMAADFLMRSLRENDPTPASALFWSGWMRFFANFFFLFGMVLAMRWMKRWWLALPLGAAVAEVVMLAVGPLGTWLLPPPGFTPQTAFLVRLYQLPFTLAELAGLAGMLWIGREIASALPGRISKRFYLASTAGGLWLGTLLVLILISMARGSGRPSPTAVSVVGAAAFIVILYAGVVMMVLVYKMWKAVQDGHARTTPGEALGLMFVPLFNFYWAFQVFWGFAKDFNLYLDRHSFPARRLAPGVFLAYVILSLMGAIPILGLVAAAADLFVGAAMVAKICDAINSIPAQRPSEIPAVA